MSVQSSIDSRNSAIHSAYRISLRPSSLPEPRHPSLKVVKVGRSKAPYETYGMLLRLDNRWLDQRGSVGQTSRPPRETDRRGVDIIAARAATPTGNARGGLDIRVNDPSAGSPTEETAGAEHHVGV